MIRYKKIPICKIYYIEENGDFRYEFIPLYEVIKKIDDFPGIPGLDLSLYKNKFIRKNIEPTFIHERIPCRNMKNLSFYVENKNFIPLRWLIDSDYKYFGDDLDVISQ